MKLTKVALLSLLLTSPLVADDDADQSGLLGQVVGDSIQPLVDTINYDDNHDTNGNVSSDDSNDSQKIDPKGYDKKTENQSVGDSDDSKEDLNAALSSLNSLQDRSSLNDRSVEIKEGEEKQETDMEGVHDHLVIDNHKENNLPENDDVKEKEPTDPGLVSLVTQDESDEIQKNEKDSSQADTNGQSSDKSLDEEQTPKTVFVDYANKSTGALILDKAKNFQGTSNLLLDDKDRYAMIPCSEKTKYVIIGLSEDILVKSIKLSSFERYSSLTKQFQVLGSQTYPVMTEWEDLGTFEAKLWFKENKEQIFELKTPSWARYLKFRFLSHYGDEHYCTLTQIKVHGSTTLQGFHEMQLEMEAEHIDNTKSSPETEESLQDLAEPVMDDKGLVTQYVSVDSEKIDNPEISNEVLPSDQNENEGEVFTNYEELAKEAQNDGNFDRVTHSIKEESTVTGDNIESTESKDNIISSQPKTTSQLGSDLNDNNTSGSSHITTDDIAKTDEKLDPITDYSNSAMNATNCLDDEKVIQDDSLSIPQTDDITSSSTKDAASTTDKKSHSIVTEAVKAAIVSVQKGSTIAEVISKTAILNSENDSIKDTNGSDKNASEYTSFEHASEISSVKQMHNQDEGMIQNAESSYTKDKFSSLIDEGSTQGKERNVETSESKDHDATFVEALPEPNDIKSNTKKSDTNSILTMTDHAPTDSKDLFRRLTAEYSNSDCLKSLDFQDFKKKAMKAIQIQKGSAQGSSSQMPKNEPIFKKLTDEIKVLQTSQGIYEQYIKAVNTCYESVLTRMGKHIKSIEESYDQRLSILEEKINLILLEKPIPVIISSNSTYIENEIRYREEIMLKVQRSFSVLIKTMVFIYHTISDSTYAILADERVQKSIEIVMGYKRDFSIFLFGFVFCFLFTNRLKRVQNSVELQVSRPLVSSSNDQRFRDAPLQVPSLHEDNSIVYSFRSDDRYLDGENEIQTEEQFSSSPDKFKANI